MARRVPDLFHGESRDDQHPVFGRAYPNYPRIPGRGTVIRPVASSSAGSAIIPFQSWCEVDAATPGSTFGLNTRAVPLVAQSKSNNTFDDVTNGKKVILNFEKKVVIGSYYAQLFLGNYDSNGFSQSNGLRFTMSGNSGGPGSGTYSCWLEWRVRLITAEFDTSTLNWGNVVTAPSITIGSTVFDSRMFYCQFVADQISTIYGQSMDTRAPSATPTADPGLTFVANSFTCFGLLVDVKPVINLSAAQSLTAITQGCVSMSFGNAKPFAVYRNLP